MDNLEGMKSRLNRKIVKDDPNNTDIFDEAVKDIDKELDLFVSDETEEIEEDVFSDDIVVEDEERKAKEEKTETEQQEEQQENLNKTQDEVQEDIELKEENTQKETDKMDSKENKDNTKSKKEKNKESNESKESKETKESKEIKAGKKEYDPQNGDYEIGIYDRRSIVKIMRTRLNEKDESQLKKVENPPETVLSIRYQKLFHELLYALFFAVIIATFHILLFKDIEVGSVIPKMVIFSLTGIGIMFLEKSYKESDFPIFLRGLEFSFVAFFVLFFTADRYISTKLVTMILPAIAIGLIFYYIIKVLIIEVILRNEYIKSLSDVKEFLDDENAPEIGMLYNKRLMDENLNRLTEIMESKVTVVEGSVPETKIDVEDINPYKKTKRTKAEQEAFEKWKAKVKS